MDHEPRILLIEDNVTSAKLISHILRKRGVASAIASDGQAAFRHLEEFGPPDAIVSDIRLPEADGIQLISEVRGDPRYRDIPVVFCSSASDLDTVRRAGTIGCKYYVLKPVDENHLMRKLALAIGNKFHSPTTQVVDSASDRELLESVNELIAAATNAAEAALRSEDRVKYSIIAGQFEALGEAAAVVGAASFSHLITHFRSLAEQGRAYLSSSDVDDLSLEWESLVTEVDRSLRAIDNQSKTVA